MHDKQTELAAIVGRIELALKNQPDDTVPALLRRIEALLADLVVEVRALRNGQR